jgi:hypothetical protein
VIILLAAAADFGQLYWGTVLVARLLTATAAGLMAAFALCRRQGLASAVSPAMSSAPLPRMRRSQP